MRLMQWKYPPKIARQIASYLITRYPTHGFVIDRDEAEAMTPDGETYGLGLQITPATQEIETIFHDLQPFLDKWSILGRLT
jgi:hypothetical protein